MCPSNYIVSWKQAYFQLGMFVSIPTNDPPMGSSPCFSFELWQEPANRNWGRWVSIRRGWLSSFWAPTQRFLSWLPDRGNWQSEGCSWDSLVFGKAEGQGVLLEFMCLFSKPLLLANEVWSKVVPVSLLRSFVPLSFHVPNIWMPQCTNSLQIAEWNVHY